MVNQNLSFTEPWVVFILSNSIPTLYYIFTITVIYSNNYCIYPRDQVAFETPEVCGQISCYKVSSIG